MAPKYETVKIPKFWMDRAEPFVGEAEFVNKAQLIMTAVRTFIVGLENDAKANKRRAKK